MDAQRFDALTRALSTGSRRGLLGVLLTLTGLRSLLGFLGADDVEAKGRRKRRKRRHKHGQDPPKNRKGKRKGKGRKGKRRKRCQPESRATICAGKCGIIKNAQTCQKPIDCGSCACDPPCPVCQTCQAGSTTLGACVPDPAQVGDACGLGQTCRADGACACDSDSCSGTTPICAEGTCVACSDSRPCSTGCCADEDGSCQPGTEDGFCGGDSAMCRECLSTEFCQEATCQACNICADECTFDSIQAAINDPTTQDGDTFTICPGRYLGLTTFSKSITIQGAGDGDNAASNTILDGNRAGTVVTIGESQTVTLRGLRITGGEGAALGDSGGGIYNREGSTLTLSGCTIAGNAADFRGGGIFKTVGSTITLNSSTVTENEANVGGGLLNFGAAILNGCAVTHNTAQYGGGFFDIDATTRLDNCTGSHNTAFGDHGGGFYESAPNFDPNERWLILTRCTVTDNVAGLDGGAIYGDGFLCTDVVTSNAFTRNQPNDVSDGITYAIGDCSYYEQVEESS